MLAFARAAFCYWLHVYPHVCRERRRLRRRALEIADPALRRHVLAALEKRENLEGAAAFAAFVPRRRRRRAATEALVRFQALYNLTDALAEEPCTDPGANAHRAHGVLLAALQTGPVQGEAYLTEPAGDCRLALEQLDAFPALAAVAERAAERIAAFQELSCEPDRAPLARWADGLGAHDAMRWWEVAGAAGSSLVIHATIAAAAAGRSHEAVAEIEHAYFPWVCALHSLLDSLLDEREDARIGQLSLVGCYADEHEARIRLGWLARRAGLAVRKLPGREHAILLAGMAALYLSQLEEHEAEPAMASLLTAELKGELGLLLPAAMWVFRLRRLVTRTSSGSAHAHRREGHARQELQLEDA